MRYIDVLRSADGSRKYLWQLDDGKTVESIYFIFNGHTYACISSQVGCNVKCVFCETGKQNNLRNLQPAEMVQQVRATHQDVQVQGPLQEVVFAGMGEPLLNSAHVFTAAQNMLDAGLATTISLSTSGIIPKMYELPKSPIKKLFISLHASNNEVRDYLVPINTKYPIEELLKAAAYFYAQVGNKVTATYLMFKGINDTDDDLQRLYRLLDPSIYTIQLSVWNTVMDVNLIPSPRIHEFETALRSKGYDVFVLNSKGSDVEGGCGQLRSRNVAVLQTIQ